MNTVVIIIIILLLLWWFLMRPGAMRPSDQFKAMCSPGYMPTGSGCVPTDETIGSS
jgi:hypothetical protein